MGKEFKEKANGSATLSELAKKQSIYNNNLFYEAMRLLERNKHIKTELKDEKNVFQTTTLTLTHSGEDAYNSGIYLLKNVEDINKVRQPYTVWIIPSLAFLSLYQH